MLFLYIHHVLYILSQLNMNVSQLSHIIQLLVHGQGSQELPLRVSVNAVRASIDIRHIACQKGLMDFALPINDVCDIFTLQVYHWHYERSNRFVIFFLSYQRPRLTLH